MVAWAYLRNRLQRPGCPLCLVCWTVHCKLRTRRCDWNQFECRRDSLACWNDPHDSLLLETHLSLRKSTIRISRNSVLVAITFARTLNLSKWNPSLLPLRPGFDLEELGIVAAMDHSVGNDRGRGRAQYAYHANSHAGCGSVDLSYGTVRCRAILSARSFRVCFCSVEALRSHVRSTFWA
jgi:hypothetical protein